MKTAPRVLSLLPGTFAICRLAPGQPAPRWAEFPVADFASVTRTSEELSVIGPAETVPPGVMADRGWRCLRLEGPFDLLEAGILAGVIGPLAGAGVSAVAVATYDTDYILVRDLATAVAALAAAGHRVSEPSEGDTR